MVDRPIKPQWFQVLLALRDGPLHGYGIQRAVLSQTEDQMRLWPAMLYRSLGKLADAGLVRAVEAPDGEPEDERRQYYELTSDGAARLQEEADMLARWVHTARGGA